MSLLKEIKVGPATVRGWIRTLRVQNRHSFIILRDGVGSESQIQGYVLLNYQRWIICRDLPPENNSFRPFGLEAYSITILGPSHSDFPSKRPPSAGVDVKLGERHLYIRDPKFALITKLRAILVRALREHFAETNCSEIFPPSFVGNQCEGGATLFKLDYPDKDKGDIPAYLTQSSQFYLEYVLPGIGDCYCIAPSFRAERSQTSRHLTEFLHAECEWNGILSLEDHLDKLRSLISGTVGKFLEYGRKYLDELGLTSRVEHLFRMCDDIVVLTHREAIDYSRTHLIYKDPDTKTFFDYEDDIPEMPERRIIDMIGKIVLLVRFPKGLKSFYFEKFDDGTVRGCDVEVPGVGEIIGSCVRLSDYDALMKVEDYREYLDLRKYGIRSRSLSFLVTGNL